MNEERNMWGNFIWKEALQKSTLSLTWGIDFNNIVFIDNGTEFICGGNKWKGKVNIQHQGWGNTFTLTFSPNGNPSRKPIVLHNVMLDKIVSVISHTLEYYRLSEKWICTKYPKAS